MTDFWTLIISNSISITILGFLFKIWIDKRLTHSLAQEMEKFKAKLALDISKFSTQHKWIFNKKMESIEELHKLMSEVDQELCALLMNIKIKKQNLITDRAIKFSVKYLEFNAFLYKKELYFEESLFAELKSIYKPFFELANGVMDANTDSEKLSEILPNTMDEIFEIGKAPRTKLVKLFRKISGLS
jgi:hypothetical protein